MSETMEHTFKDDDGTERTVKLRRVLWAFERWTDRKGNRLLLPDYEIEGWGTNLADKQDDVIDLHKGHSLCEQYLPEIKSDMDLERLPSDKFATNAFVLSCAGPPCNILRAIGQVGLMDKKRLRRPVKRRRLKTVMQELMYFAGRVIAHARGLTLRFSRHATAHAEAFAGVYERFAYELSENS